jgi:hypothetical protein
VVVVLATIGAGDGQGAMRIKVEKKLKFGGPSFLR